MICRNESTITVPDKHGIAIFCRDLDNAIYFKQSDNLIFKLREENGIYKIESVQGFLTFNPSQVENFTGERIEVTKSTRQEYFFKILQPQSITQVMGSRKKTTIQLTTEVESFIPDSNQTAFMLSTTPDNSFKPILEINGQEQTKGIDYTITGKIIQWISLDFSLSNTDRLNIYYSY